MLKPRAVDGGIDRPVGKAQRQRRRLARVARVKDSLAIAVGDPDEPTLERPLGMRRNQQPPERIKLVLRKSDSLLDQLLTKPRGDRSIIGAGMRGAGGQRAWQPGHNLAQPNRGRLEQSPRGGPAMRRRLEPLARARRLERQARLHP